MKKLILLSITFFAIVSCDIEPKSPTEKLKDNSEKMLKSNLNDPSSYEFVSFEIDTVDIQIARQRLKDLKASLLDSKSQVQTDLINSYIETLNSKYDFKSNNINFSITYRAKNKFGALVLGSSKVISDKDYNLISIEEN